MLRRRGHVGTAVCELIVAIAIATGILGVAPAVASELYIAWAATEKVFPECGSQGSVACDYDLIISIEEAGMPINQEVKGTGLALLPRPLLSLALFATRNLPQDCDGDALSSEIMSVHRESANLADVPFAAAVSEKLVSGCFALGSELSDQDLIMIWVDGIVVGWIDCSSRRETATGSCSMSILSTPNDDGQGEGESLTLEIALVAPQAVEALLSSASIVAKRSIEQSGYLDAFTATLDKLAHGIREFNADTMRFIDRWRQDRWRRLQKGPANA